MTFQPMVLILPSLPASMMARAASSAVMSTFSMNWRSGLSVMSAEYAW